MELRHLRYFVAVAEERSFTRAAQRLGIHQPPLSQQLQALERELGVRLLERLPRGVELTAAGAAFLDDARVAMTSLEAAKGRARRVASGIHGSIVLGLASSAATHRIVPDAIALFRERHRDVHLSFVEGNAATVSEAVLARRAHAALLRAPVDQPADLRFDEIFREPMLAIVPAARPLAARAARRSPPYVTLRELAGEPLVLVRRPGAPGMYAELLAACDGAGLTPRVVAEVGNMLTNILLVASGVGASVVPASMAGIQSEHVRYLRLRGAPQLAAPLTLLTRRDEANPAVARFAAVAHEVAKAAT
jgi:DNA-binding transcriptional LysR family regulator